MNSGIAVLSGISSSGRVLGDPTFRFQIRGYMAETRGQGTLYRQRNSRFWWYRIGFQGRIICASTKTSDRREAREVLKQKYRELEAAKGGFVTMPGPEVKRVSRRWRPTADRH